jgi:hypothetical protein
MGDEIAEPRATIATQPVCLTGKPFGAGPAQQTGQLRHRTGTGSLRCMAEASSGYKYRIEVYYEATLIGGLDGLALDPREILEARLFSPDDLPAGMPQAHRELARESGRP